VQSRDDADDRYRSTLDNLLEGFQIIGRDWTYLYVNPAAAEQGRSTPDALIGRKMWEAYPGIDQAPFFATLRECMSARTAASLENLFTYPDGRERWFEIHVEPVPEGICIQSFDIQVRKDSQTALERFNAELEARVSARTRDLQELNEELEAFAFSVSHDLRAPLRHIHGHAEMLGMLATEKLNDEEQDCLVRIGRATKRMTTMIDDLLNFSRLGRAALDKQPLALAETVHAARADLAPELEGREVKWTVGSLPEVLGDPALVRLAMVNILSNAIKYTRGKSPAQISIGAERHAGTGEHVIWIRDNGVGFDMRSADRLFGVFQRLHRDSDFEGTGIGLANVRRIISRHGGRTWAEAVIDQGATFYVSFPPRATGEKTPMAVGP
jgi:PAS domain S-box-containing protein